MRALRPTNRATSPKIRVGVEFGVFGACSQVWRDLLLVEGRAVVRRDDLAAAHPARRKEAKPGALSERRLANGDTAVGERAHLE